MQTEYLGDKINSMHFCLFSVISQSEVLAGRSTWNQLNLQNPGTIRNLKTANK